MLRSELRALLGSQMIVAIYNQGRDASKEGKACDANPYSKGSNAYEIWESGFKASKAS